METIKFTSDSNIISIIAKNNNFEILEGGFKKISLSIDCVKSVVIKKRSKRYRPDLFFILYGVFTIAVGIGIFYLFFKTINAEYFKYGATTFVFVSVYYFYIMARAANKRNALFIETKNETLEFPINKASDEEKIISFFKAKGVTISR